MSLQAKPSAPIFLTALLRETELAQANLFSRGGVDVFNLYHFNNMPCLWALTPQGEKGGEIPRVGWETHGGRGSGKMPQKCHQVAHSEECLGWGRRKLEGTWGRKVCMWSHRCLTWVLGPLW